MMDMSISGHADANPQLSYRCAPSEPFITCYHVMNCFCNAVASRTVKYIVAQKPVLSCIGEPGTWVYVLNPYYVEAVV